MLEYDFPDRVTVCVVNGSDALMGVFGVFDSALGLWFGLVSLGEQIEEFLSSISWAFLIICSRPIGSHNRNSALMFDSNPFMNVLSKTSLAISGKEADHPSKV